MRALLGRHSAAGPRSSNTSGRTHACRGRAEPWVYCPSEAAPPVTRAAPPPRARDGQNRHGSRNPPAPSQLPEAESEPAAGGRPTSASRTALPLRKVFQTLPSGELPALAGSEGATGSLIKGPSTDLKPRRAVTPRQTARGPRSCGDAPVGNAPGTPAASEVGPDGGQRPPHSSGALRTPR